MPHPAARPLFRYDPLAFIAVTLVGIEVLIYIMAIGHGRVVLGGETRNQLQAFVQYPRLMNAIHAEVRNVFATHGFPCRRMASGPGGIPCGSIALGSIEDAQTEPTTQRLNDRYCHGRFHCDGRAGPRSWRRASNPSRSDYGDNGHHEPDRRPLIVPDCCEVLRTN